MIRHRTAPFSTLRRIAPDSRRALHIVARIIAMFTLMWCVTPLHAQSDPILTQYWAMPTYYNPGAIGTTDYIRIRGGARLQWLGIENAPKSFLGAADSPFKLLGRRWGVGVTVTQESLGLFSNLYLGAQLGTSFKAFKGTLSIGVQAAYYNSRFRSTDIFIPDGDDYHDSNDTALPDKDLSGNSPDFSVGLWYSHKLFNVGLSAQHLLQPKVKLFAEGDKTSETHDYETELQRTIYFTADSNIELKNTLFTLQPSVLVYSNLSSFGADITARVMYNKMFSAGVAYRWNQGVGIMLGVELKNFILGYAYDIPTNAIAKGSSGSHELVAGYRFKLDFSGKNKNRHRSIRIM